MRVWRVRFTLLAACFVHGTFGIGLSTEFLVGEREVVPGTAEVGLHGGTFFQIADGFFEVSGFGGKEAERVGEKRVVGIFLPASKEVVAGFAVEPGSAEKDGGLTIDFTVELIVEDGAFEECTQAGEVAVLTGLAGEHHEALRAVDTVVEVFDKFGFCGMTLRLCL